MSKAPRELHSRPPLERIMHIHNRLQQRSYPNASLLAREFEVAARTILRDIDFMRLRWRLPIAYDPQRYGYYYTCEVKHLPSVEVTESEIFALLVAHKAIAQYSGTPFQRPLETAFRKLAGHLDSTGDGTTLAGLDTLLSFRPFAPEDTDLETFEILTRALRQRRVILFTYRNLGAKDTQMRKVRPYHLTCIDNLWYLIAYDLDRKGMRKFVLTRLSDPEVTSREFKAPKDFNPAAYMKGDFGAFTGQEDYEVVIDFDLWATDLLRGRRWHASQQHTEMKDGASRLRLRLNNIEEVERWVLSWGVHATVIRPRTLINRLRATARALTTRYPD